MDAIETAWGRLAACCANVPAWQWAALALGAATLVAGVFAASRRARSAGGRRPTLAAALGHVIAGRGAAAERELRRLVTGDPGDVEGTLWLGHLLRRRGHTREATLLHRQLLARRSLGRPERADAVAGLIADGMQAGHSPLELSGWTAELLRLAPAHPFGLEVLVEERRLRGDLAGALRAFRRLGSELETSGIAASEGSGREREALFLCREADRLRRRGALADAHRVYRVALRRAEHHAAPHLGLAEVAQARGRARAAIRFYRRAAERGGCELALDGLERLESSAAEPEAAAAEQLLEEIARRGLEQDRNHHRLRRPLIRLYRRRGDARKALGVVTTAVELGDRSPWMLLTGAEIAEELGDTKTALDLLRSGLDAEAPA